MAIVPLLAQGESLSVPGWVPDGLLNPPQSEPWLCRRDYLTPDQGQAILDAFLETHPTKQDWEAFAVQARQHILEGAGLDPLPRRTPLDAVITDRRVYEGYSVENVRFQSIPGYWVTGNLYRPLGTGSHAAILHTHGHSSGVNDEGGWARHGRFKDDVQSRAATLARMGAVSLTIDMVGYGDSGQFLVEDVHHSSTAMTLQLWNAIRAIDFLTSLDGVDPDRIGVTGHSGGGTQAFLLSAVDMRIKVCVPVAMVSSWFFGGCDCESGRPIHAGDGFFMNNAMIAALTAPRPLKLISDGSDWTLHTPTIEFPFIAAIYGKVGEGGIVAHTHLANEGHNYGISKRLAMYPFMAQFLKLDRDVVQDSTGRLSEPAVTIEDPQLMRCFPEGADFPFGMLRTEKQIKTVFQQLAQPMAMSSERLAPYGLLCDGMENPHGVDSPSPRLSWKLRAEYRGAKQSAYRIQMAASADALEGGCRLTWDSGRIESSRQLNIPIPVEPSGNNQTIYWRVKVWDEKGTASEWSPTAHFMTGLENWDASWIAHPDWIQFNRPHLGYRSLPADSTDVEKWIQLDLGKQLPIDQVNLHALRHTVAERLGFPQAFRVELFTREDASDAVSIVDYTNGPLPNQWFTLHEIPADGMEARYVRVTATRLRELNGETCLAFKQIEVLSGGNNVALGSAVTASDSIEEGVWSASAVVDGKGLPGANPIRCRTALLKKEFILENPVDRAVLNVAGLGQYVLYINGERVGTNKLSPGWTDTRHTVPYETIDVTDRLLPGSNVIGIALAGGMYSVPSPQGRYTKFVGRFRPLKAIASLRIGYEDGSTGTLVTDDSWNATYGPTTYSHVYGGEDFDARKFDPGWSLPGASEGEWTDAVVVSGPGGTMQGVSGNAPPLRTIETRYPVRSHQLDDTTTVYDLGQNASIMVRLKVEGPAGSTIRIYPSELLGPDGDTVPGSSTPGRGRAWWQYTLAGKGTETWESEFFYQGARYLKVVRKPASEGGPLPRLHGIQGLVTHSASPPAGYFETSSDLWNRTRDLVRWAQRSNMVSVLTDCPHRERLGWLEQYHLNGPSIRYEFNLANLYRKTFRDMSDAQTATGLVPDIAPEFIVFPEDFRDSPEWGSAIILAAWQQYLFAGDDRVLKDHYAAMAAYFNYLRSKSTGNLLHHGLGDWYDIGPERPGYAQLTPIPLTASAIFHEDARRLADIAAVLGMDDDRAKYLEQAARIREAFNEEFLRGTYYATNSQTSNAMPLGTGLVPESLREVVLDSLVEQIRSNGNTLTAGDVGHRYLLKALAMGGESQVIHDMHHQAERPGYGMQLERGATSLTEAWDANRHSSQNHFMLGHIIEWFYGYLAGIQPVWSAPGFEVFRICPAPVGGLTYVRARYESVRGTIRSEWRIEDGRFVLDTVVPANSRAIIELPHDASSGVLESGVPVDDIPSIKRLSGRTYSIGSGTYSFSYPLDQ